MSGTPEQARSVGATSGATSKSVIPSHPLFVTVVGVLATAFVTGIFFYLNNARIERGKAQEFSALVDNMQSALIRDDFASFRRDATIFRTAVEGRTYNDALHLNHWTETDNLDLIVNASYVEINRYLLSCGVDQPKIHENDYNSCSATAKPYIEPVLEELSLALLKRIR